MNSEHLEKLLRKGLMTHNQTMRNSIIREMQKLPSTQERNYAIAGLKDSNTTMNDLLMIEAGTHYKNWLQNDIKEEINLLKEENILNNFRDEDNDGYINIHDSFGEEKNLKINVDLEKIMNTELGDRMYGSLSMPKSNDKIMKCIKIFDEQLSHTDKNDIIDSLIMKSESIKKKKDKKASKKIFVDAINDQLSDDERRDFISLLISRAKSYYNSFIK